MHLFASSIQYNDTPLGLAIGHGHADIVQVLLLHQVDVNGRDKV